jgi:hypothetical protein
MTMDTYGHLLPNASDRKELAAAELSLINASQTHHDG